MSVKKGFLAVLFWLPTAYAQAEGGKGLSRISTGGILWGIFIFPFGLPALAGLVVYLVIKLINKKSKISLTLIIFIAVLVWWFGWWVALGKH